MNVDIRVKIVVDEFSRLVSRLLRDMDGFQLLQYWWHDFAGLSCPRCAFKTLQLPILAPSVHVQLNSAIMFNTGDKLVSIQQKIHTIQDRLEANRFGTHDDDEIGCCGVSCYSWRRFLSQQVCFSLL